MKVNCVKYLGVLVGVDGGIDVEVIRYVNQSCLSLVRTDSSSTSSLEAKMGGNACGFMQILDALSWLPILKKDIRWVNISR